MAGEMRISRSLVDFRPSVSFNRRRSSRAESSQVVCPGDMVMIDRDVADSSPVVYNVISCQREV